MFNLADGEHFRDAEKAREFLEQRRWPNGPICPHCDGREAWKITAKPGSKKPVRPGVYKCKACEQQFTVTVNTIFEDSHIPLHKWLLAFHLLCASKKGMSAHQLHRMLGVTYKTAWFMAHRIRYAMGQPSFVAKLKGVVECDETYVGGKGKTQFKGRATGKTRTAVVSLVKRGGEVRSFPVTRVTGENLSEIIRKNVDRCAHLCTDQFASYTDIGHMFAVHGTVNHSEGEYSRGYIHVNTAEGVFAILKRGLTGVYHQVGQHHLHRYLAEFDFRFNSRKIRDDERTLLALNQVADKRLMLRDSTEQKAS